ncbi:MAG: hypothetical protein HF982_13330 [Desulfobacteraceae bacterium]|nr:hypothetical protein [Desulfobacteraceae bacterium]MBC2720541.1 hypothetical protein [Desulfobacteraceae bacterium]
MGMINGKPSKTGIIGLIDDISLDRKARVFSAVRFTRNKDNPPYGLIDDETD